MTDPSHRPNTVLAVDPGRDKCGIAVVGEDGAVRFQGIVPAVAAGEFVAKLLREHDVDNVVVGDRTGAGDVTRDLRRHGATQPKLVDEHRSTEEGRRRYFRANPPRGWRRLLPVTLQTPPRPYDDYVAIVLAERFFASRER